MKKIEAFKRYIADNKIYCIFLIIVAASMIAHLTFREDHFQEADSTVVYPAINDFPVFAMRNLVGSYQGSSFIRFSPSDAEAIVSNPTINSILNKSLGVLYTQRMRSKMVEGISSNKPLLFYVRAATVMILSEIKNWLPRPVLAAFSLPLATTYSFGTGLLYGLVTYFTKDFAGFMSATTFLTVVIFHISVLLLFYILRKLSLKPIAAFVASLMMLFSLTLYSYSYHLGSTVWIISSSLIFILLTLHYFSAANRSKYLLKLSYLAGILVFFNYLIVFYYLSAIGALIWIEYGALPGETLTNKMWNLIKTQKFAFFSFLVCGLLFFSPGAGNKAAIGSLNEFFIYTYYIILNYFSLDNENQYFDILQFIVSGGVFLYGAYILFLNRNSSRHISYLAKFIFLLGCFFVLAVFADVLSLIPSRHVLFLAPIMYILFGFGVERLITKRRIISALLIGFIIYGASLGLKYNFSAAKDICNIKLDSDYSSIILIRDMAFQLQYKDWGGRMVAMPVPDDRDISSRLFVGQTYWYMGQTTDFSKELEGWSKYNKIDVQIITSTELVTNVVFPAYDPAGYAWNRPNNCFVTKFKVIKL
ncbi:MAG: hypothetical protein AAB740_03105 [Patescibacteria group bacterium]